MCTTPPRPGGGESSSRACVSVCLAECVWGRGEGHLVDLVDLVDLDLDHHAIV